MASPSSFRFLAAAFLFLISTLREAQLAYGVRRLAELAAPLPGSEMSYHNGAVLTGDIPVSIYWYGTFPPAHKAVVTDFILSFSAAPPPRSAAAPTVARWWALLHQLYLSKKYANILLGKQLSDDKASLGKTLTTAQVTALASKIAKKGGIAVVVTAKDVAVSGFCEATCGTHATTAGGAPYIWVGDSGKQCPGQCAWPFHQPTYGPQTPALVPPNADAGLDGIIINLASMLAGAVTNPTGQGYFQGDPQEALEAATACAGVYGKESYPGNPGNLLVDPTTTASYNARGVNNRMFLLSGLFNPSTSTCTTLV